MKSTHDILRERLELAAGIFPPCKPAPSLDEIYAMQWNAEFERKMRNRMAMGILGMGRFQAKLEGTNTTIWIR